jgi:NADH-quinone oxidoreductase subunit D
MAQPEKYLRTEEMILNMGPSHPSTHGIIRIILSLDGERVVKSEVEIGYMHRAFEKQAESVTWNQVFPYTDRLNYVSPLINNVGYALAVEKLLGIEVPERCKYVRVIMSEISRITDHLTAIGAAAMELGAFSVFLYMIKAREYLWEVIEMVTGARVTVAYVRVGGLKADLPEGFAERTEKALAVTDQVTDEVHKLLTKNRIFIERTKGIGAVSKEDALGYGFTGPLLRACGVNYDVRKAAPYLVYDQVDFDIPLAENGDAYDRYLVRMEEMRQSTRIIRQAIKEMPDGPIWAETPGMTLHPYQMEDLAKRGKTKGLLQAKLINSPNLEGAQRPFHRRINAPDKRVVLPAKDDTYSNIEGLMNHFMLIMSGKGIRPPKGEVYFPVEGANGELGFYIVSDGTDRAWRVRVRPPCFPLMAAFHKMINGGMVADIVPAFGSVNMIAGELDR